MINQSNIIRVLIADDRYIVRQGLVALLDRESDVKRPLAKMHQTPPQPSP